MDHLCIQVGVQCGRLIRPDVDCDGFLNKWCIRLVSLHLQPEGYYCLMQSLKKRLTSEQQIAAHRADEIASLKQTVARLTAVVQCGAVISNAQDTWADIVNENHRLQAEKSSLVRRQIDTETSLRGENIQLSRMVRSSLLLN